MGHDKLRGIMSEKIRWGVSADSSGLLTGTPVMWQRLWGEAIASHKEGFVGFEMFPWGWLAGTEAILKQAQELEIPIAAIHGRTGGIHDANTWADRMILMTLNEIMPDSISLIKNFGRRVPRIVLHTPEFRNVELIRFLADDGNREVVRDVSIENHMHIGASGTALEVALILKRARVKRVSLTFDLFHCGNAANHYGNDWTRRWKEVRAQAEEVLDGAARNDLKVHFHLPVGPGRDGLPTKFITDGSTRKLWRQLGGDLEQAEKSGLVGVRTIENQQVFLEAIGVYGGAVARQIKWNREVVNVLAGEGVI